MVRISGLQFTKYDRDLVINELLILVIIFKNYEWLKLTQTHSSVLAVSSLAYSSLEMLLDR